MYVNIPRASRQRALIINKLGTRHDVPQGGVEGSGQSRGGGRAERPIEKERRRRKGVKGGGEEGGGRRTEL